MVLEKIVQHEKVVLYELLDQIQKSAKMISIGFCEEIPLKVIREIFTG